MSRLPGPFAALARQVAGQITDVTDCSWERDTSAVWRLSSASGGCWYLKRHSSDRFHAREVAALRDWAPALGPGRVPELAAVDPEILVMVVTAVPGEPVPGLSLSARAGWLTRADLRRRPAAGGVVPTSRTGTNRRLPRTAAGRVC